MSIGLALILAVLSSKKAYQGWPERLDLITCYDCDGHHVVGQNSTGEVMVWDANTGKLNCVLHGADGPILFAILLPDRHHVIGQGSDYSKGAIPPDRRPQLIEWDIQSGKKVWSKDKYYFQALIDGGKRVIAYHWLGDNSNYSKVICLTASSGKEDFTFPDYQAYPRRAIVQQSPDKKRLLYSDVRGISVFDMQSKKRVAFVRDLTGIVPLPASFIDDGHFLYRDAYPDNVDLYSIPKQQIVKQVIFPPNVGPSGISWLPRAKGFIAFCVGNPRVMSYTIEGGLVDRGTAEYAALRLLVAPNERHVVTCFEPAMPAGEEQLWVANYEAKNCKKLWQLKGAGIKILPNNQLVLEDGDKISFVDLDTGRTVRSIVLQDFNPK